MSNSPFVVVRYAPGSCGRFISILFQLSPSIAHWNENFENNNKLPSTDYVDYIKTSFPNDATQHLRREPDLPYFSDFYSGTYDRGENITYEQYVEYQKQSQCHYFFKNLQQEKKINLILHKSKIPKFMSNSSMINVIIDTEKALHLSQKLIWLKQYQVIDNNKVKRLIHDPNTCNAKRKHLVEKFFKESSIIEVDNIENFYKSEILDNFAFRLFQNVKDLVQDPTNLGCKQNFFYLSNIFDKSNLVKNINEICRSNAWQFPDPQLVELTFDLWWDSQKKILAQSI